MPGELCSPDRRLVRRLYARLRGQLCERRPLRRRQPDANADRYPDADQGARNAGLLPVCRVLRGSGRRHVRRVRCRVRRVVQGRVTVRSSNAHPYTNDQRTDQHPDADRVADLYPEAVRGGLQWQRARDRR